MIFFASHNNIQATSPSCARPRISSTEREGMQGHQPWHRSIPSQLRLVGGGIVVSIISNNSI